MGGIYFYCRLLLITDSGAACAVGYAPALRALRNRR
jgi:hypothetical protein